MARVHAIAVADMVSIRCRARRTAELRATTGPGSPTPFLFAVVRDVQRNIIGLVVFWLYVLCFYSLSCETYSGTACNNWAWQPDPVSIRCRARRTAEPSPSWPRCSSQAGRFYSLSCETYSGTRFSRIEEARRRRRFLFAVVRDVQRNSAYHHGSAYHVSIRCRARRTAER